MTYWRVVWNDGFVIETPTLKVAKLWRDDTDDGTIGHIECREGDGDWADWDEANNAS